jgi:hypothetical protein
MTLLIFFGLLILITFAFIYGLRRWESATEAMHIRLEAAQISVEPKRFDTRELNGLPAPVQRYLRAVLKEGQPMVSGVRIEQSGTFNMHETGDQWKPFTSLQRVITQRPGFDWQGRIRMFPGLTVHVHDAYISGEGILRASLFGLVSLVNERGTMEIARGELMRFLAEAAWYPTALLPSQGAQWEAVDDKSAKATLRDGDISVTMLFRFNENSLIESVRAEARGRTLAGKVIPTPWEGRWTSYELRNGMITPAEGEVAWMLPDGPKPYWRGRITRLNHEFSTH